ncbi:MAG: adenylate/guanylate cyclase domain-containing protein [Hyphomicrobiaceae bacterium]|nr:adenylate/guanylate cyclase domain-containing protein [Hyphomicrobiaceae bacterium]
MIAPTSRRLAAILAADVAGYSALIGADEDGTVRTLKEHQAVVFPLIAQFGGRVIDTAGDGIMAEFGSVVSAVECALLLQSTIADRNKDVPAARRLAYRIGVNLGDVIFDEHRIYGDGVNIAARLESLAEAGGICISGKVHDEIKRKIEVSYHDLGYQNLKNISEPVQVLRIYRGNTPGDNNTQTSNPQQPIRRDRLHRFPLPASSRGVIQKSGTFVATACFVVGLIWLLRTPGTLTGLPATIIPHDAGVAKKALDLNTVPFVSDFSRKVLRENYLPGKDIKAFAISFVGLGIATGKESEASATSQALDQCQRANSALKCEVFAIGDTVVSGRDKPPLPPQPWVPSRHSTLQDFDVSLLPFGNEDVRTAIRGNFGSGDAQKALAISPLGKYSYYWSQSSTDEAVRRTLEMCGDEYGLPCRILAINSSFVLPVPETMRVTGFFNPEIEARVAIASRPSLKQKFGARNDWSAVATGVAGLPGFASGQSSEASAIAEAKRLCGEVDLDCRIIAISDFSVAPR